VTWPQATNLIPNPIPNPKFTLTLIYFKKSPTTEAVRSNSTRLRQQATSMLQGQ